MNFIKEHSKDIIFSLLIIGCLIFCGLNLHLNLHHESPIENTLDNTLALVENEEINSENQEEEEIYYNIDIKGAVKNPGVYKIKSDAIINDAIELAGGFKTNAYQDGINLSKKISDEMVIYIYTKSEINKNDSKDEISQPTYDVSDYVITESVNNHESIIIPGESSSNNDDNDLPNSLVNINTASVSELTSLNGIGESKAQAIIEYRKANGNFKSIEDLLNVKGIGDTVFAKIKDYITV